MSSYLLPTLRLHNIVHKDKEKSTCNIENVELARDEANEFAYISARSEILHLCHAHFPWCLDVSKRAGV